MSRTKKYYAGLTEGPRHAYLLGPYETQEEADANIRRAHDAAIAVDSWCWFAVPTTIELHAARHPPGRLNELIGADAFDYLY